MKRIEIDVSRTDFEVKKGKEFKLSFKNSMIPNLS